VEPNFSMKNILLLPFLFIGLFTIAQTKEMTAEIKTINISFLTFDIATPVNPVAPRYRFGFNFPLNEAWRWSLDLGYGSENTTFKQFVNNDKDNYELYEGRTEVYHIFNPSYRVNMYISGEVYYINHQEEYRYDSYEQEHTGFRVYYDSADLEREKYGFNLKYGVIVPFGNKVGMNAYIGAGPRIRDNVFSNVVGANTSNEYYEDEFGFLELEFNEEGRNTGINLTFGVKFFYKL